MQANLTYTGLNDMCWGGDLDLLHSITTDDDDDDYDDDAAVFRGLAEF
jgi:hypothetical protein